MYKKCLMAPVTARCMDHSLQTSERILGTAMCRWVGDMSSKGFNSLSRREGSCNVPASESGIHPKIYFCTAQSTSTCQSFFKLTEYLILEGIEGNISLIPYRTISVTSCCWAELPCARHFRSSM